MLPMIGLSDGQLARKVTGAALFMLQYEELTDVVAILRLLVGTWRVVVNVRSRVPFEGWSLSR